VSLIGYTWSATVSSTVQTQVSAWLSCNSVARINEVTLRRARLVVGWVTVSGFNSRCRTFISVCNQPPRST